MPASVAAKFFGVSGIRVPPSTSWCGGTSAEEMLTPRPIALMIAAWDATKAFSRSSIQAKDPLEESR